MIFCQKESSKEQSSKVKDESLISLSQKNYCELFCKMNIFKKKINSNKIDFNHGKFSFLKTFMERKTPVKSFKIHIKNLNSQPEELYQLIGKNSLNNIKPILETEKLKIINTNRKNKSISFKTDQVPQNKYVINSPRNFSNLNNETSKKMQFNNYRFDKKFTNCDLSTNRNVSLPCKSRKSNSSIFDTLKDNGKIKNINNEKSEFIQISHSNIYFKIAQSTKHKKNSDFGKNFDYQNFSLKNNIKIKLSQMKQIPHNVKKKDNDPYLIK